MNFIYYLIIIWVVCGIIGMIIGSAIDMDVKLRHLPEIIIYGIIGGLIIFVVSIFKLLFVKCNITGEEVIIKRIKKKEKTNKDNNV